jgi:hypothetical protein
MSMRRRKRSGAPVCHSPGGKFRARGSRRKSGKACFVDPARRRAGLKAARTRKRSGSRRGSRRRRLSRK